MKAEPNPDDSEALPAPRSTAGDAHDSRGGRHARSSDQTQVIPRFLPFADARGAADPVISLKAHALTVVLGVVPASWAVFCEITRRLEVGDGVFVQRRPVPAPLDLLWRRYILEVQPHDPLAPRRIADSSASVITLGEVAAEEAPPRSYTTYLDALGAGDAAAIYLRAAGSIVGMIALLRAQGEPPFAGHEVLVLRRLHPLLEHAYVHGREPDARVSQPDPLAAAGLTPRETQVALLVGTGATNAEIARALQMGLATVKTHLTQIYAKVGLRSRTQLAILLRGRGEGG